MRMRRAAAALTTWMVMAGLAPALHAEDKWIEVKSAHFSVVSNDGPSNARTLAWQLEQIRGAVAALWPWAKVDLNLPLTVIAVKDEASMKALAPKYWEQRGGMHPASVWVNGADQYYLAIRTDQRGEDTNTVNPHMTAYFSYVSLVLRQSVERELPMWLARGLSGVLSNTIVRDNELLLGPPIPWHVEQVRSGVRWQVPVLVKMTGASPEFRSDDGARRFDAEAWALVHMLMFGDSGARGPRLDRFAKLVASGTDQDAAFVESLGRPEDLEAPFVTYVNRPVFSYTRIKIDVSVEREKFPVRPLPPAESASVRALFHATMNRPVEAGAAIAEARKAGGAPDSFVAEALLFDRDDKKDEAIAAYTRAVEAGSKNSYAHYRLAALLWSPDADHDKLVRIEALLTAAIGYNTRSARAYSFLGETRSILGTGDPLSLVRRAISLDPSEPGYRLTAARVEWRQQNFDDALKDARAALAIASDADDRRAASEMVASIERAQSQASRASSSSRPSPSQGSSQQAPPPSTAAAARPGVVQPIYRKLEPGEDRLEGTLTRIECTTAGAAVFHVQSAGGPVLLNAPRMAEVEFITQRDDLGGSIGCGPLKEPFPVYVTSRTTTGPPAGKVVVAIEFLPKKP